MKNLLLCAALLTLGLDAHAVNKCTDDTGRITYQSEPCPGAAKVATLAIPNALPGKVPTGDALESNKRKCAEMLKGGVLWKDPESVKLGTVYRIGAGPSFRSGVGEVVRYAAEVNAKNSYGGYTGPRTAFCEFNRAETAVEHVHVSSS